MNYSVKQANNDIEEGSTVNNGRTMEAMETMETDVSNKKNDIENQQNPRNYKTKLSETFHLEMENNDSKFLEKLNDELDMIENNTATTNNPTNVIRPTRSSFVYPSYSRDNDKRESGNMTKTGLQPNDDFSKKKEQLTYNNDTKLFYKMDMRDENYSIFIHDFMCNNNSPISSPGSLSPSNSDSDFDSSYYSNSSHNFNCKKDKNKEHREHREHREHMEHRSSKEEHRYITSSDNENGIFSVAKKRSSYENPTSFINFISRRGSYANGGENGNSEKNSSNYTKSNKINRKETEKKQDDFDKTQHSRNERKVQKNKPNKSNGNYLSGVVPYKENVGDISSVEGGHYTNYFAGGGVGGGGDGGDEGGRRGSEHNDRKFKKLTYEDVEKSISKYFVNNKLSNEFDLLITFLKGRKNIYVQSKNLIQFYSNILNITMIVITASIAVFGPIIYEYTWSIYLISALNSIIAILISLANYLKFETIVDNFLCISNQYQKMETTTELTSNKLYFLKSEKEKNKLIIRKIEFIEEKLKDINEVYKMIIPELIKKVFPVISHINIFTFIKKIETYKSNLIMNLRNVKNEIRYIMFKWETDFLRYPANLSNVSSKVFLNGVCGTDDDTKDDDDNDDSPVFPGGGGVIKNGEGHLLNGKLVLAQSSVPTRGVSKMFSTTSVYSNDNNMFVPKTTVLKQHNYLREKKRFDYLVLLKDEIKEKICHYKNTYGYIDEIFTEEIHNAEYFLNWIRIYCYCTVENKIKNKYDNPIIQEIFQHLHT